MGILNRLARDPVSTTTDPVQPSAADTEKVAGTADGSEHGAIATRHAVSPDVERRVVRKLDRRMVPLVAGLCMA